MVKNYFLSFMLLCFAINFGYGQSDIIISQYIEDASGGSFYKGIEIFNVSGAAITFTVANNLQVYQGTNGGACSAIAATNITSGTLGVDEVWVIGTTDLMAYTIANGSDFGGTTTFSFAFNGNDALEVYLGGTIQDSFGTCGTDPGSSWTGSGVDTRNNNLQIKNALCDGDTDGWTDPSVRFDEIANGNTPTGFGDAPASCNPTNTILEFSSTVSTLSEGGAFVDVCVEITNPSATVATTVDIILNVSSTATNGTDYDDGAGIPAAISFPQTLTFPAGSITNECLTIYMSNDDLLIEGNETVVLDLTSPAGGDSAALGSDDQHILTITDNDVPGIADVVITEIMYNSAGADDEWIEICNVSGSPQVLNDYTVRYNGSVHFTFPSSGVIMLDGTCITVSLGSNGDGTYNNDCPFTPDYGIGASTNDNDNLVNSSATISLVASDGTTDIDVVTYDDSDGADNTGESLHVVNTSLDNSVTNSNYWEVLNGGSPGINSLISPCTPLGPEINVEGTTINFPDIADGDITPNTFDGTDFGNSFIGSPIDNTFRIENFAGTTDLIITSVTVLSGDTGDFSISVLPSSPIAALGTSNFDIEFNPTVVGTRTAVIQIISNDADENPYTFTVTGNGLCFASAITASPDSGPENTIVTVTGTDLATATASFNGLPATVVNISATIMEVTVPSGATTGNLEIIDSTGCPGFTSFTVIDTEISSCEGSGGTTPTDLFISEITDTTYGGLSYVELFNGTGLPINIDDYSIEVIANGDATATAINIFDLESVVVPNGSTYVIALGRQTPINSTNACTSTTGGSGELASSANAQFTFGGINKKVNEHDVIRLVNLGTTIDEFGVYLDNDWMDSTTITGLKGFNFRRSNTATILPDPTFTLAELGNWTVIDWVGSGAVSCSGNDYSNIGLFDFSTGTPPVVNSILSSTSACNETTISVSATEGFGGGNALEYYWYFYNPAQSGLGWQAISTGGIYTTVNTSPDLIISDTSSVLNYQFYCEVREDDASCYSASNAIKVILSSATWMSGTWNWNDGTLIGTMPNLGTNVVLAANYDTGFGGIQTSFSACSLTIDATFGLLVQNNTYIEIQNDITANGDVTVFPQGSVVQINDLASVTATGTITVQKETSMLNTTYDYTYWSSPVVGETVENIFSTVSPSRRFIFNATNFVDTQTEINNTGTFTPGPDDIDDNGDDWQGASGAMIPGIGYAATASLLGPPLPVVQQFPFVGAFNNGVITPTIVNNSGGIYNDWNFIGNPYPSAIDTSIFFTVNSGITNTIYLWSQATAANFNASGNEGANFSGADYAIISASGVNTAGGSGIIPTNFVPSGQGFFIEALSGTNVTFNNSMRVTGNNNQFFRNTNQRNVLWLNLNSDNGAAKQIAVAYLEGATDNYDGSYYDVKENLSTGVAATIYSTILESNSEQFVIQGKSPSSLDENEVINIGFKTLITVPTLYTISIAQFEGYFYTENNIYVKDNLLGTTHNLKGSNYTFTSDVGEFNERFEIVYRADALSIDDNLLNANALTISELENGDVQISVNKTHTITNVEIIDITGRHIYSLKGNNSTEVYNLSSLSKAPYIAKVTLSNGQVISKKGIKQR